MQTLRFPRSTVGSSLDRAAISASAAFMVLATALFSLPAAAQAPAITPAMRPFVSLDAPAFALTNVRVIDGTGKPAKQDQTILVRDGQIIALGDTAALKVPDGFRVLDLRGKTALPGLVQLHEHQWLSGPDSLLNANVSFPRLELAGGVTWVRTAGAYNPYADLREKADIQAGLSVGPTMNLSVYLELFGAPKLNTVAETDKYIDFWLDSGFNSVKAYRRISESTLKEAIEESHRRGVKITGHLCSVTYKDAALMGIDNIEHGFLIAPDFIEVKPDTCYPNAPSIWKALDNVDPNGKQASSLISTLISRHVAITSTLVYFEQFVSGIKGIRGADLLVPTLRENELKDQSSDRPHEGVVVSASSFRKAAQMELSFMKRGGLLLSGTDSASVATLPGYASARQMEIMVENGFTPLEAIKVGTYNGAVYLGIQDKVGSLASGKVADIFIVDGNPASDIRDINRGWMTIHNGIGYDPKVLRASVKGFVGLQ